MCRSHFTKVTDRSKKIKRFEKRPPEPIRRSAQRIGLIHFLPMVVFSNICFLQVSSSAPQLT
jgi:hypothetical protein